MSLDGVRDEFLARRAASGDGVAFVELARRYEPLVASATRRPPDWLGLEDARQAALIGLYQACRETDGLRTFAGIARLRVQWAVAAGYRAACTFKHRILTDATRDGHGPDGALAHVAGPAGLDPARVVELRAELRERWQAHQRRAREKARAPHNDLRRRYSDEQIDRACALIANGSSVAAAAAAVGAHPRAVNDWAHKPRKGRPAALAVRRARFPQPRERRYSDEEIGRARKMVASGHTITAAAAAVGASHPTVLRWLHKAA
jgi:transposase